MPRTVYARLAVVIKMPPSNTGRLAEVQVVTVNERVSPTYLRRTARALRLGTVTKMWPVEFWWKLNAALTEGRQYFELSIGDIALVGSAAAIRNRCAFGSPERRRGFLRPHPHT